MPDYVFAAKPSYNYRSYRTIKTCAPTAYNIHGTSPGEKFNLDYKFNENKKLAADLLSGEIYNNKVIFICWEHDHLNDLAEYLGVEGPLPEWPDSVFYATYVLNYSDGKLEKFEKRTQELMYGDTDTLAF